MRHALTAAVAALCLAAAFPATAATEIENLKTYCKPDIERLCASAPLDGIKACLKSHEKEISIGCAEALKALKDG